MKPVKIIRWYPGTTEQCAKAIEDFAGFLHRSQEYPSDRRYEITIVTGTFRKHIAT